VYIKHVNTINHCGSWLASDSGLTGAINFKDSRIYAPAHS
jgi:hypothetical protein